MKLEIWQETKETQLPVYLTLVESGGGSPNRAILLVAVDEHGHSLPGGTLLGISPKGLYLHSIVSPKLGLPLDGEGRLKLEQK